MQLISFVKLLLAGSIPLISTESDRIFETKIYFSETVAELFLLIIIHSMQTLCMTYMWKNYIDT